MKYRKRPVLVEAHRWFKNGDHPDDGSSFNEGRVVRYFRHPYTPGDFLCACGVQMHDHGWIDTLEGGHNVCPGDWIITGIKGEHYPCKPDIFAATYEAVDDAAVAADAGRGMDAVDLVERLYEQARGRCRNAGYMGPHRPEALTEFKAADEIARLRARLARVVAYAETVSDWQDDSRFADGGRLAAREVLRLARGDAAPGGEK